TADTDALFFKAIEQKVAFVVGSAFYPTQPDTAVPRHEFRLNFITPSIAQIQTGIASLAKVIDVASQQVS
ncbi:MAG: hypothetical protein KDD89_17370, partial [Anaerolineales bacterium]|nr:hypothetical protein [Anaerolineales bacterium]